MLPGEGQGEDENASAFQDGLYTWPSQLENHAEDIEDTDAPHKTIPKTAVFSVQSKCLHDRWGSIWHVVMLSSQSACVWFVEELLIMARAVWRARKIIHEEALLASGSEELDGCSTRMGRDAPHVDQEFAVL